MKLWLGSVASVANFQFCNVFFNRVRFLSSLIIAPYCKSFVHAATLWWFFNIFCSSCLILHCVIFSVLYHELIFWEENAERWYGEGLAWLESCSALTSANVVERKRYLQLHPTPISLMKISGVLGIWFLLCSLPVLWTENYLHDSNVPPIVMRREVLRLF